MKEMLVKVLLALKSNANFHLEAFSPNSNGQVQNLGFQKEAYKEKRKEMLVKYSLNFRSDNSNPIPYPEFQVRNHTQTMPTKLFI